MLTYMAIGLRGVRLLVNLPRPEASTVYPPPLAARLLRALCLRFQLLERFSDGPLLYPAARDLACFELRRQDFEGCATFRKLYIPLAPQRALHTKAEAVDFTWFPSVWEAFRGGNVVKSIDL